MKTYNLDLGKAGEHLSIFELLMQGHVAYLSDQGLPYDIVVDCGGALLRGQVRSTMGHSDYGKSKCCLRFGTRNGKGSSSFANQSSCDFYAFVSLTDKLVGFFHVSELGSGKISGKVKQTVDIRSKDSGYCPKKGGGRMLLIEDYSMFSRVEKIHNGKN